MFSSARPDWGSPTDLFTYLNDEFGFVLDVAAQEDETAEEFDERVLFACDELEAKLRKKYKIHPDEDLMPGLSGEIDRLYDDLKSAGAKRANFKCPKYFTEKDDAFQQIWAGPWYCNPPYGRGLGRWTAEFVAQCERREELPEGSTGVALIPARTDTAWMQDYVFVGASEVRLIRGRLHFDDCDTAAPFPSAIAIYRPWEGTPPTATIVPWDFRQRQLTR